MTGLLEKNMKRDGARRNQQTYDDFKDAKLTRHRKLHICNTENALPLSSISTEENGWLC